MILRPYQDVAVSDASKALDDRKNTIVVAPTGAGKTIMLSALIGKRYKKGNRVLVLQHRNELVEQNMMKFSKINPSMKTSIVNGTVKNWDGDAVFSMIQTLSRDNNLSKRPKFDMVVVDESHHVAADTYKKVINAVRDDNEYSEIVGFTATPNRGDGKALKGIFDNCSHQIELTTLIREGFLVPPRAFVIDVGVKDKLSEVRKLANEFDMEQVEAIMNRTIINQRVVQEWLDRSGDRKTVVFCSTINHANALLDEFLAEGINAEVVTSETPKKDRSQILHDLEHGDVQVVVNVAVLTEGFDAPPVSCIVLTRPCSYKSTMVQMIGRGLRIIDPEIYSDILKTDCIVMDFGTSVITHGSIDDAANLDGREKLEEGEAPTKICPECEAEVHARVKECPICGHVFQPPEKSELDSFVMTEYDIMKISPFLWIDPYGKGTVIMATGFQGSAMVGNIKDHWIAIAKPNKKPAKVVAIGEKVQAMAAADDFLREVEDGSAANKTKRWLNDIATPKQKELLRSNGVQVSEMDLSFTKYKAACMLGYYFNRNEIDRLIAKNWKKITGEDYAAR